MSEEEEVRDLQWRMAQAAADEDYELAARLRDELTALTAAMEATAFRRQVPGRMGLGTDQQVYTPPEGWVPPRKPDLMTSNTRPRRGGKS